MRFFTICARNRLVAAAALAESLARHHPDCALTVFLLDRGEVPGFASTLSLRPIEDAVPAREYERRRCYYDLLELATSCKPLCFQLLFREGNDAVVYLDPDIYVFRPLVEVQGKLNGGTSGILIPHLLSPLPEDGLHPDDLDILRAGIYNLGFLALGSGAATSRFLQWWATKLEWLCLRDPREGVFTDQKWMNFAPVFLPGCEVLHDPTFNVAFWNLPARELRGDAQSGWTVDGSPLTFFHYSGFDADRPGELSIHQNRLRDFGGPLAALLAFYASRLEAYRHAELRRIKFDEPVFGIGARWDPICRALYRDWVRTAEREPEPLRDQSFLTWMASSAGGQQVSRYVQTLLRLRPDVAAAYPRPAGADRKGLVAWMKTSGASEVDIDPELLRVLGIVSETKKPKQRIVYVGYLKSHLGIGEAARGYLDALAQQSVELSLLDISNESRNRTGAYRIVDAFGSGAIATRSDVALIHVNADELPRIMGLYIPPYAAKQKIGIWAWETGEFPDEWVDRFELLDEVWVPSDFVARAVEAKARCPVNVVPYVVNVPPTMTGREAFGFSDREFVFLMQFDFNSISFRKNPEGAIRAFKRAFPNGEPVKLFVKTMNGIREPGRLKALEALANDSRIWFCDEAFDTQRRFDLLAAADCYVSLHRAEGFGLSLAESMAYGKPVLATGWSGNMEFMNVSNSCLIPFSLQPLAADQGPYRAGTIWAEPDLDAAADAMRRAHYDAAWREALGARAREDIASRFSAVAIGKMVKRRIELPARNGAMKPARAGTSVLRFAWRHPGKYLRSVLGR